MTVDPNAELRAPAAWRDLAGASILAAIGVTTGSSALLSGGPPEMVDMLFEAAAVLWFAWAALRIALSAR